MKGILSSTPAPAAVRILLGGHLLLLVAASLGLGSLPAVDTMVAALMLGLVIGGIAVLIAAIIGEPAEFRQPSKQEGGRDD
jgi:hypothetical protein